MTKHHFEAIARTVNLSFRHAPNPLVIETLAVNLADDFERINPLFSREKFLAVALDEKNIF
tara:strand:- start:1768 stop:1950 length:183 start_codon:yes stop_codon:yes gene_type:complete